MVSPPCLQWAQPTVSQPISPCFSTTKRPLNDVALACRSAWLGTMSNSLCRSRSMDYFNPHNQHKPQNIRRTCSAILNSFSDEEFSRKIQELTLRFHVSDDQNITHDEHKSEFAGFSSKFKAKTSSMEFNMHNKREDDYSLLQNIGDSSDCSVKKAFSSMVFIVRELHSYTIQMREILFYEDLKGILGRVQCEIHSSFVWLFQQIFSHTPTFMMYVMILLANFTVHSMSNSATIATASTAIPSSIATISVDQETTIAPDKWFSTTTSAGKTTSIGGGNGGGGKTKPVGSGMEEGDGWAHQGMNLNSPIFPDGTSTFTLVEEESKVWDSIMEEASRMESEVRDESLNTETMVNFVSPVSVNMDVDVEYEEYFRVGLVYQTGLAHEPNSVLLLANYAQFLYLVVHDYDRAEEYFKRAIGVEPKDAEAHNKYANFLWKVRNDLWAAEETFLEAISAEPSNPIYSASYAHFLWNTGAEDTCYPLDSLDDDDQ